MGRLKSRSIITNSTQLKREEIMNLLKVTREPSTYEYQQRNQRRSQMPYLWKKSSIISPGQLLVKGRGVTYLQAHVATNASFRYVNNSTLEILQFPHIETCNHDTMAFLDDKISKLRNKETRYKLPPRSNIWHNVWPQIQNNTCYNKYWKSFQVKYAKQGKKINYCTEYLKSQLWRKYAKRFFN